MRASSAFSRRKLRTPLHLAEETDKENSATGNQETPFTQGITSLLDEMNTADVQEYKKAKGRLRYGGPNTAAASTLGNTTTGTNVRKQLFNKHLGNLQDVSVLEGSEADASEYDKVAETEEEAEFEEKQEHLLPRSSWKFSLVGLLLVLLGSALIVLRFESVSIPDETVIADVAEELLSEADFIPNAAAVTEKVNEVHETEKEAEAFVEQVLQPLNETVPLEDRVKELETILNSRRENADELATIKQTIVTDSEFKDYLEQLVGEVLDRKQYESLGSADYASEASGASIIPTLTSPTFQYHQNNYGSGGINLFGIVWKKNVSPDSEEYVKSAYEAIRSDTNVGKCWPMDGSRGTLTIKLSRSIQVRNVSVYHVPPRLSLKGDVSSAPREIDVYALKDAKSESDNSVKQKIEYVHLGGFTYLPSDRTPQQTFSLFESSEQVNRVQFRIKNNYGNEGYTCIYRVMVHGE